MKKNYVDIVTVRHGNTSADDKKALEAGNAHLSEKDFSQVEETVEKLSNMSFDYVGVGATLRMVETWDGIPNREGISSNVVYKVIECDTRLDSRTNSNGPDLWPANHDDAFLGDDAYHPRAQKILKVLTKNKLPNGGRALLVTTGAIIVPFEVIAAQVEPKNEADYFGPVYSRFAPKPAEIRCFRYCLESGALQSVTLEEVKSSS